MWLIYALITIICYAGMDLFIKKASGKIDDYLGTAVINFFALIPALLMYTWLKLSQQNILVTKDGTLFSAIAGLFIGVGSITLIRMFAQGANLSIGSPIVRIGTVILTTLLGIFLLNEAFTAKQIIGIVLSVVGVSLLIF